MNTPVDPASHVLVIGAGPAGLMAAERLALAGHSVDVFDKMPSVARKFLMAGRGGLNLTHSEPRPGFDARYGAAAQAVSTWLDGFDAAALTRWVEDLGQETFIGTSGRVFPRTMKASPLLRSWLSRLEQQGVRIHTRHEWHGTNDNQWMFETPQGPVTFEARAVVLALGGGSYARLGSDGRWMDWMAQNDVATEPLRAANVGFEVAWSPVMRERFAGQPLKNLALKHKGRTVRGEAMIAGYGLEGGVVYALSAALRETILSEGRAELDVDLRPDLSIDAILSRLEKPRGSNSLSNFLRKTLRLDPASIALMREEGPLPDHPPALAARIKSTRLVLTGIQNIDRAISSAGGIRLDQIDETMMLRARVGVFVCGEMLDWEAPTGGYLLQACFASGVRAADGVIKYLGR